MSRSFSRRDFFKIGALALGGIAMSPYFPDREDVDIIGNLGRIAYPSISVLDKPKFDADTVGFLFRDDLINLYKRIIPPEGPAYNPVWYRVWGGYIHSAFVQPVEIRFNTILERVNQGGQLTFLSVPFSQPYSFSKAYGWQPQNDFLLYYGSNHWITGLVEGPDRKPWYQIIDELWDGFIYYAPVHHFQLVADEAVTPLSTDVPDTDKHIEVSLSKQQLSAFEVDKLVFRTAVSTGITSHISSGNLSTMTSLGTHYIQSKLPSKHMGASRFMDTLGDRVLPGVFWTSFFAAGGYAIHGTYWHDNFGWPMSRGCINMSSDDAKWVFRWVTPVWEPSVSGTADWEVRGRGTKMVVSA